MRVERGDGRVCVSRNKIQALEHRYREKVHRNERNQVICVAAIDLCACLLQMRRCVWALLLFVEEEGRVDIRRGRLFRRSKRRMKCS